ncbi:hypothetical protein Pan161_44250 [Gimesia algae]|uniref:Uncharacterized protein n=1 Tax=Gimesia algae TaxID=2527971 RepID=A0A517VID1_9PLAN|nr:hypothetical protein Pan161_44250 [Gimesia algae]
MQILNQTETGEPQIEFGVFASNHKMKVPILIMVFPRLTIEHP